MREDRPPAGAAERSLRSSGRGSPAGDGNLRSGSGRPYGVAPGDQLERALRETLSHHSATSPTWTDPAGRALSRARRIQRRRSVIGVAMAAIATVAVSALTTQLAPPAGGSANSSFAGNPLEGPVAPAMSEAADGPSSPPVRRVEPPLVDVVAATALHSTGGQLIDLSGIGTVVGARRTGDSWLMITEAPGYGSSLWSVREGRVPHVILAAVDDLVLAPDGRRVAWRDGSRVFVAPIEADRLGAASASTVSVDGRPVRFVGAGLLLMREWTGAGTGGYSIWWPDRGPHEPAWAESVTAVYGLLPDGATLVGQVSVGSATRPCLALLNGVKALAPMRTVCTQPLAVGTDGVVSPDGRWLIANEPPGPSERALVIDLRSAFGDQPVVKTVDFPLTGDLFWTRAATMVHAGRQGDLVRVELAPVAAGDDPVVLRAPVPGARAGERLIVVSGCATGQGQPTAPVVSCR